MLILQCSCKAAIIEKLVNTLTHFRYDKQTSNLSMDRLQVRLPVSRTLPEVMSIAFCQQNLRALELNPCMFLLPTKAFGTGPGVIVLFNNFVQVREGGSRPGTPVRYMRA